jgi:hypothetical protein
MIKELLLLLLLLLLLSTGLMDQTTHLIFFLSAHMPTVFPAKLQPTEGPKDPLSGFP